MDTKSIWPKGIGEPAIRAFAAAGYETPESLNVADQKELLKLHGVGPKAIRVLKEHGYSFKRIP